MDEELFAFLNPQQSSDPRSTLTDLQQFGIGNQESRYNMSLDPTLPDPTTLTKGFGLKEGVGAGLGLLKTLMAIRDGKEGRKQNKIGNAVTMANLSNQANLTNATLEGRQRTHLAADPNATSVADYMSKFGVSGTV